MKYVILCSLILFSFSAQAQTTPTTRTAKGRADLVYLQEVKARLTMIRDLLVSRSVNNDMRHDRINTLISDMIEEVNNTATEEAQVVTTYKTVYQYTTSGGGGDDGGGDDGGGCGGT